MSAASQSRLQSLVSDALAKGATLLTDDPRRIEGAVFTPAVIGQLKDDMKFARDEAFGPLAGYIVVQNEEEAIKIANGTEYGLAASVFTRDLRKGFAIAKKLQSGYVK